MRLLYKIIMGFSFIMALIVALGIIVDLSIEHNTNDWKVPSDEETKEMDRIGQEVLDEIGMDKYREHVDEFQNLTTRFQKEHWNIDRYEKEEWKLANSI